MQQLFQHGPYKMGLFQHEIVDESSIEIKNFIVNEPIFQ